VRLRESERNSHAANCLREATPRSTSARPPVPLGFQRLGHPGAAHARLGVTRHKAPPPPLFEIAMPPSLPVLLAGLPPRAPAASAGAVRASATSPAPRKARPRQQRGAGSADADARGGAPSTSAVAAPPPDVAAPPLPAAAAAASPVAALPANAAAWSEYEAGLRLGGPPEQGPEDT